MPDSAGQFPDISHQVAEVAQRLRRLEAGRAQQPESVFAAQVAAEVRRALARVAPEGREAFLEEVQARFPDWELGVTAAPAQAPSGDFGPAELDPQSEIGQLVARMIEHLPETSDDEHDAAADQLAAAGFVPRESGSLRPDVLQSLVAGLGLKNGDVPDPNRVAELVLLMAEFSSAIQQLTWATWRTIAPTASPRRSGSLQKTLGRFVTGQADAPREMVAADLNALRHLIASIISAVSDVGHQFAATHLARFMPAEIESAVDAEGGGGMFKNKAALCWKKYAELSETLEAAAIESEIRRVIAEHAEHLLKGLGS
jgi:hypothetical protein